MEAGQKRKYKYNPKTHSVDELPEMKEPFRINFEESGSYMMAWERYKKHIASLKSYPLPAETPAPKDWPEVLEEGKDFKLEKRSPDGFFVDGNYSNTCVKCKKVFHHTDKLWFMCKECCNELLAIPINNKIIMDKNFRKKEVIDAYVWIRQNNNSIPDDILDLMKEAALEKLNQPEQEGKKSAQEILYKTLKDLYSICYDLFGGKNAPDSGELPEMKKAKKVLEEYATQKSSAGEDNAAPFRIKEVEDWIKSICGYIPKDWNYRQVVKLIQAYNEQFVKPPNNSK